MFFLNTFFIDLAARKSSRYLQKLSGQQRSDIIQKLADLLNEHQEWILECNQLDLEKARSVNLAKPLFDRLVLTETKLQKLTIGLQQIAISCKSIIGRIIRRTKISDGLELNQITAPLGVLLVIFESRPDCLPQIAALSIASGNGLLAKGGKEALETNKSLHRLIQEALESISKESVDAVTLVNTREDIAELIKMDSGIDLIIPRGSNELVRSIQNQSKNVPVLGHSEGICHVYVDDLADLNKAINIGKIKLYS